MTVSSTTSRKSFTGDAVTTSFGTSPMVFFDSADLTVYVVTTATGASTALTENTHYTVSGGDGSTGTVSLAGGTSPYGAPSAAQTLLIVRTMALTQTLDLLNNDNSDAEALEDALDKLTMLIQQSANDVDRVLRQPDSDAADIAALPTAIDRASKYLAFDADGDPVATPGTTSSYVVTTFMETVLDDTTAAAARSTLGAAASGANTDITSLSAPALGAATATTQSASDNTTKVATTAMVQAAIAAVTPDGAYSTGHLHGFTLSNNGSDATNDIDIAVGSARDSTDVANILLAGALTKRLDAAWAVGTNQGGLDTGAVANGTYFVYAIKRSDTAVVDVLFSASASSPTMPANYDYKRRIGAFLRESGAIVGFVQDGDEFFRKVPITDVNTASSSAAAVTRTLSVPIGIRVKAILAVALYAADVTATPATVYISDLSTTDTAASSAIAHAAESGVDGGASQVQVWTNTSGQIRSRNSSADADLTLGITTQGWIDTRGRVA